MTETFESEVEFAESTVEGRIEMAAAEATLDAVGLLNKVVRACGLSQKEIAEALGVGDSRVSQVLTGDGNLKIATLARYIRAAGYALKFEAVPVDANAKELAKPRSRSRRDAQVFRTLAAEFVKCWESPVLATTGVGKAYTFHVNEGSGQEIMIGQRTSVDMKHVPAPIADWVVSKTFTPDSSLQKKLAVEWHNASGRQVDAELKLDRKYVDH